MTNPVVLLSFLDGLLGAHQLQRDEVLYTCPFCRHHHKKLSINLEKMVYKCWVCGKAGRKLFSLLKQIRAPKAAYRELNQIVGDPFLKFEPVASSAEALTLPVEFRPLWEPTDDADYRPALTYCVRRGLVVADILKYQLGYCADGDFGGRLIIPSYDAVGVLNFFTGRSYRNQKPPYLNPVASKDIVGFENLISWDYPIVLCEGPLDAMAIKRNVVPLFGKSLSPYLLEQLVINETKIVYLALDTDALKQSFAITNRLIRSGIEVRLVRLPGKDPGALGFTTMCELIRNTPVLTTSDLLRLQLTSAS